MFTNKTLLGLSMIILSVLGFHQVLTGLTVTEIGVPITFFLGLFVVVSVVIFMVGIYLLVVEEHKRREREERIHAVKQRLANKRLQAPEDVWFNEGRKDQVYD